MKLNRQDKSNIKKLAQGRDYESIVALLDHYISESLETLVKCQTDHRFVQGRLDSLTALRSDIVIKEQE